MTSSAERNDGYELANWLPSMARTEPERDIIYDEAGVRTSSRLYTGHPREFVFPPADTFQNEGTPVLNSEAVNEAAKASSSRTNSIHSENEEENARQEDSENDDEDVQYLSPGFLSFLDDDDDEDEQIPKVTTWQTSTSLHTNENTSSEYSQGASQYPHPIQWLVANSDPEYATQWQFKTPGYNPNLASPWNFAPRAQHPPDPFPVDWSGKYTTTPIWEPESDAEFFSYPVFSRLNTPYESSPDGQLPQFLFDSNLSPWDSPREQESVQLAASDFGRNSPSASPKKSRFADQFAAMEAAARERRSRRDQSSVSRRASIEWFRKDGVDLTMWEKEDDFN